MPNTVVVIYKSKRPEEIQLTEGNAKEQSLVQKLNQEINEVEGVSSNTINEVVIHSLEGDNNDLRKVSQALNGVETAYGTLEGIALTGGKRPAHEQ